ncbi:hypothetical protein BS47DRAFT_1286725 [Hydnum rufescens UP504]|uniref:Uncharacterized protein n=1 Tax=Hydnum rufescens UP504 TaxID=1448309 RepID=A0A9P6BB95_9AGAM|nr:hypothetical protein BS47DRAFT_1286725 [Hydnum rufescens UP504]
MCKPRVPLKILNYALTLEHLEAAFYSGGLEKFDNNSFNAVQADRGRFQQIADQEAAHVAFLTAALGKDATAACNYSFPYNDVSSFVALASVLESVGGHAAHMLDITGAAQYIQNPVYLTAAGAILTTEARHQAYISYVDGQAPWSGAFDTPETLSNVYSLAAGFITTCPSTNPALPVLAFPKLNVTSTGNITAGQPLTLAFTPANSTSANTTTPYFVAFFSGLTVSFAPLGANNNTVIIPDGLNGTVFAVVTTIGNGTVTDGNTVAGPHILSLGGLDVSGGTGGSGTLNTTQGGSTGGTLTGKKGAASPNIGVKSGASIAVVIAGVISLVV